MIKKLLFILCVLLFSNTAFGATYYFKNGGDDNAAGTSDATAWETIDKFNAYSFTTSDDVYFKCGGTWTLESDSDELVMDWGGAEGDIGILGAYYMNGETETPGVSGDKPIFDGNDLYPDEWQGLVTIQGVEGNVTSYMRIENIQVINSQGMGVDLEWVTYCTVTAIDADNIFKAGIRLYQSDRNVVSHSTINDAGRIVPDLVGNNNNPGNISMTRSSSRNWVHNNTLSNSWGEQIACFFKSNFNVIENNRVYGAYNKIGAYTAEGRHNVYRWNIVYGRPAPDGGQGIGTNDENGSNSAYQEDNIFYQNYVAGCTNGLFLGTQKEDSTLRLTYAYNNTFVDDYINVNNNEGGPYDNSGVKNNISWCISADCSEAKFSDTGGEVDFDYNLWSSEPDADVKGVNDLAYAVPLISKTSGWRSANGATLSADDFALTADSTAIDAGTYVTTCVGGGSGTTLVVDNGYWFTDGELTGADGTEIQIEGRSGTAKITLIEEHTLTLDTSLTWLDGEGVSLPYSGSGPDIGAVEFEGSVAITGTISPAGYVDERDIVAGGKTIVLTISGTTWVATIGADNAFTTALINGISSNKSEATGYNSIVRVGLDYTDVVRTSDTVVTITLRAFASYDITSTETIGAAIPATTVESAAEINASGSFYISVYTPQATGGGISVHNSGGIVFIYNSGGKIVVKP